MDYILPDDETMAKMREEYAEAKKRAKDERACALSIENEAEAVDTDFGGGLQAFGRFSILLYFAFNLGYNSGYGASVYDADGGLGGVQSHQGTFGDGDNFFRRN